MQASQVIEGTDFGKNRLITDEKSISYSNLHTKSEIETKIQAREEYMRLLVLPLMQQVKLGQLRDKDVIACVRYC